MTPETHIKLSLGNLRPVGGRRVEQITRLQTFRDEAELLYELVVDTRLHEDPGPCTACLSHVEAIPHRQSSQPEQNIPMVRTKCRGLPTSLPAPSPRRRR